MTFQINDLIRWKECPPHLSIFDSGRITEFSPCAQYVKYGFISNWVPIGQIEVTTELKQESFWSLYKTIK